MKKNKFIIIYFILIISFFNYSKAWSQQEKIIYSSKNGNTITTTGIFRILNLFVNIIYDQIPTRDPFKNQYTANWLSGNPDKINDSPPSYINTFLDSDTLNKEFPKGTMTKLFYEASFGQLVILGDFMIINIKQSEITPEKPGENFSIHQLIKSVINKINDKGGIKTLNGHNKIKDYDFFEKGDCGIVKNKQPNEMIDFLQIIVRNTTNGKDENGNYFNYGQYSPGQGSTWAGPACNDCKLLIEGKYVFNELTSVQCVGDKNLSQDIKNIIFHEFAHNLFGDNSFHSSGGNHYATYSTCVFLGLEGGYGLMGGYNSSLVSCNGYERLRMGWISAKYNSKNYTIAANGEYSDISKDDGNKKFILRDFITTGDAIRIKIPNIESDYAPQYLWIENHQIGKNKALDFFQYSNIHSCHPQGKAGIYMYIQVGRDILENEDFNKVYPSPYTDNLRFISAEGNWDWHYYEDNDSVNCVTKKINVRSAKLYKANPFTGYNDKQTHFIVNDKNSITDVHDGSYLWVKYKNNNRIELPFLGDLNDAFTGNTSINMSTNPAPVNTITWFVKQGGGKITQDNQIKPLKNTYLSGLAINIKDLKTGDFEIEIKWDDYKIKNNTRWAGNIILSEEIIINNKTKLLLDQGTTPTQLEKDKISGLFAPPTCLTALNGSQITLLKKSKLILNNKSQLILKKGSRLYIEKKAKIKLKKGSRIIIEVGVDIINKNKKLKLIINKAYKKNLYKI